MDAAERKNKMMDAAMKMVAEKGLDSFSVAQAAAAANINEALVYRDFGTKENLLNECYMSVNKQILDLYKNEYMPAGCSNEDLFEEMCDHWHLFFECLINSGYKTLFLQQYRDSTYKMDPVMQQKAGQNDVKIVFKNIFLAYAKNKEDIDYISTYLIDGSILFAKRIICKEVQNDEEIYQKVWRLLGGGLRGLSLEKI
jgi:Transcriptional regulator